MLIGILRITYIVVILAVTEGSTNLFPLGDLWSYSDTNTDLSATAWTTYFYDDSAWASNYARFGSGNIVVSTPLTVGPSSARYTTYYFRKVREPS